MKRLSDWRPYLAQVFIILAFAVLAWTVFVCVVDFDYVTISRFVRNRISGSFLGYVIAALLTFALLLMLGVRLFLEFIREREDFVRAAIHDLRTPVAGLRLMIGRDDQAAKLVAERMQRMVDNLSDFMNHGNAATIKLESFDIIGAYREAYQLLKEDFEDLVSGPVEVMGDGRELMVLADRTRVVQIIWNLLGNELKYAAPYGKVSVAFMVADDMVSVRFCDEGPGMTRKERKLAFNRYYRARTMRESGKGGFGIGLCAARESARQQGGDITLSANRPKGCVFTLCLKAC